MEDKRKLIGTPYDDVFRTLVTDCPKLLVRLVNEMFGKDYDDDEKVTLYANEFFVTSSDGKQKRYSKKGCIS